MKTRLLALLWIMSIGLVAQNPVAPTSFEDRRSGYELRKSLEAQSPFSQFDWRDIGPTVFSGRVTDIDVNPEDPSIFYVAYASGGLWLTENNGISFTPVFDDEAVMTIGDIAVDWQNGTIYLGSGENNSSRSSYAGDGIYKSTDGGKSWQYLGLGESHHIGRIVLDPDDSERLWVAALGHLYSPNPERGVYYSEDGGTSWTHQLFVSEDAGAIDLVIDPLDSKTLYAAMWHRERRAWNFVESGSGSGIYKTTNAGQNWTKMSEAESGFPDGEGAGRIGLDIYNVGTQSILYAVIDNYFRRPASLVDNEEGLSKEDFLEMSKEAFDALSDDELSSYLKSNRFPEKYTAASVRRQVDKQQIEVADLGRFLINANSLLFDTDVIGAEVYRSSDGGDSFTKTHEGYLDRLYNTYGYYFGQIRVNPKDENQLYIMGVPVLRSDDGGAHWTNINGDNVHADHHALWINPDRDGHVILGNDGGINISYDHGTHWAKCNSPSLGQFYSVHVDDAKPYHVYGGLQDNGVWGGAHTYRPGTGWHGRGDYGYEFLMGGDGMQVQVDPRDNETVYTGFQFGNYFRINKATGDRSYITPMHELGDSPYRWNWQAPIHLSVHNPDIFYMGSNVLLRSMNQGDDFIPVSQDLTKGGIKGDVPYGTLTSIHESPRRFGLLYAGSDDGLVHVSRDGGSSWTDISAGLPADMWVSRIKASSHEDGRVYCTLNGYRWDHFDAYVYVSEDYGQTWKDIGSALPDEPVNVILEDPKHADVLYVGTDHGTYVSFDRGGSWTTLHGNAPKVSVHDIAIHESAGHIILGTHGRSFLNGDLSMVYAYAEHGDQDLYVLQPSDIWHQSNWGSQATTYSEVRIPSSSIIVYSAEAVQAKLEVNYTLDDQKTPIYRKDVTLTKGMNILDYELIIEDDYLRSYNKLRSSGELSESEKAEDGRYYLEAGSYDVRVKSGQSSSRSTLTVKSR